MSDVANLHATTIGAETTRDTVVRERVLFITMHFPPSRDIGAHACEQLARYFPLYWWHPIVLTRPRKLIERLDPDYKRAFPGSIVEAGTLPHPIWLYRRLKRNVAQASSLPAPAGEAAPRAERGRLRRWVLSLLHTPDIYTGWILPAVWRGLRTIRRERVKRLFSSGPFWSNHITGAILSRLTGIPLTLHFRDPWMEVEQPKPVSALSMKIEKWLERFAITTARSVVCVTDWHTRLLRESFPTERAEKFVTIANGYDGAEWDGFDMDAQPDRSRFTITYSGGFVPGTRTPRPLFRALRTLIDSGEVDATTLAIRLFGNCEMAEGKRVVEIAAEYGLQDVVEIGSAVGRAEAIERVQKSNLLLLLAEGWTLQIPGKTYEYLRSGRPILALTGEGALADLLRKSGGACVADPADDRAITGAVREAYVNWKDGAPARHADRRLIDSFDRRRLASRYVALFES